MLATSGKVPVYATQEDAIKSPPPPVITHLAAGESVPVIQCVNAKQYLTLEIRLPDGRNGFVNEGAYALMRGGKRALCE